MIKESYVGQKFGNRTVISDVCSAEDWDRIGKALPSDMSRYRLTRCERCGHVIPALISHMKKNSPAGCSFCTCMNHLSTQPTLTCSFAKYDTYAVINIRWKNGTAQAYIDADDYDDVSKFRWRVSKKKNKLYVITGSGKNQVYLHRFIMREVDVPDGYEIDHVDGNSLNNRRCNLRVVSRLDNIHNTAVRIDNTIGIRGVSKCGKRVWCTDFVYNKTRFYFKHWKTVEEAVWCRYVAETYFGMDTLLKNPNKDQYLTLTDEQKTSVEEHTIQRIRHYINRAKAPV